MAAGSNPSHDLKRNSLGMTFSLNSDIRDDSRNNNLTNSAFNATGGVSVDRASDYSVTSMLRKSLNFVLITSFHFRAKP